MKIEDLAMDINSVCANRHNLITPIQDIKTDIILLNETRFKHPIGFT